MVSVDNMLVMTFKKGGKGGYLRLRFGVKFHNANKSEHILH